MAHKPFGFTADRAAREERDRARRSELNAEYRARQKRETVVWDFEKFLKAQRERITRTLQESTERVNRARWGNAHEDVGLFVVTRHGTTENSAPVRRWYQEQSDGR